MKETKDNSKLSCIWGDVIVRNEIPPLVQTAQVEALALHLGEQHIITSGVWG